ncbi:MAG: hypothetical protein KME18_27735 [Phormidium tanganyikae FI6-MK23]|jgi:hypothetical protein|nr:hypothetical protein [Phormidium tanganyikae FI6-MK23]
MKSESFSQLPWLSLGMLWFAHAMLGWYLAAHHVVWLIGVAAIVVLLLITGKGGALLEQLSWFTSRSLLIALSISSFVSIGAFLFVTDFQFLGLIFLPVVTMFLADLELRSVGFNPRQILLFLAVLAGLGIGFGEAIDLVLIPSMRF